MRSSSVNLHLIASATNHDLSGILRDFKKFTSKKLIKAIQENQHESRRDWMLKIFKSRVSITAEIRRTSFGDKTINHKNYTILNSFFKRLVTSIITR